MATYGKKKRSILPSFSGLRDSVGAPKQKKDKANKRGSAFTMVPFNNGGSRQHPISRHDDSIEDLASMLLDDTTNQACAEPIKAESRIKSAQTLPNLSSFAYHDNKSLPQLPRLLFNGDDAWAMRTVPVVTAASTANEVQFTGYHENYSPPFYDHPTGHVRKGSGPPIPRRSSKRKSTRPKGIMAAKVHTVTGEHDKASTTTIDSAQSEVRDSQAALKISIQPLKGIMVAPQTQERENSEPKLSTQIKAVDINDKIEAMIAATKALKGDSGPIYQGPYVPTKKRRLKDNKVLAKMRTAINDRLNIRSAVKRHDPARDDHLLDASLNELPDFEEDTTVLTTMEIRMNEGDNFKNPKIFNLTGHGGIPRKPLADDGKSLRSRKSVDDPFAERPYSSGLSRTPTSFEGRLREDMSMDQSFEVTPGLPSRTHTPKNDLPVMRPKQFSLAYDAGSEIPDLLSRTHTPKNDVQKARNSKQIPGTYDADFDALFSSSPLAQSTPRIRLEPTDEDGKRTLKSVPAQSRSLFDTDMDIDTELPGQLSTATDTTKRKNMGCRSNSSKKMKKHPSPSKAELEGLEKAMRQFPAFKRSESFGTRNDVTSNGLGSASSAPALARKDCNAKLYERKIRGQVKTTEFFQKVDLTRTTESMPAISSCLQLQKSLLPRPERKESRQFSIQNDSNSSMMDIDELQWDQTKYDIGMKRV